jgi:hypothetical protein
MLQGVPLGTVTLRVPPMPVEAARRTPPDHKLRVQVAFDFAGIEKTAPEELSCGVPSAKAWPTPRPLTVANTATTTKHCAACFDDCFSDIATYRRREHGSFRPPVREDHFVP